MKTIELEIKDVQEKLNHAELCLNSYCTDDKEYTESVHQKKLLNIAGLKGIIIGLRKAHDIQHGKTNIYICHFSTK